MQLIVIFLLEAFPFTVPLHSVFKQIWECNFLVTMPMTTLLVLDGSSPLHSVNMWHWTPSCTKHKRDTKIIVSLFLSILSYFSPGQWGKFSKEMAFKPVFKEQTWSGHIKIGKGHVGRLYMLTKKNTSIKNAKA